MSSVFESLELFNTIANKLSLVYRQSDTIQQFNKQNWAAIMGLSPTASEMMAQELATKNFQLINSLDLDLIKHFPSLEIQSALSLQWDAITKASQVFQTSEIVGLKNSFLANDFAAGIQAFLPAISGNIIEAPNLAFLKTANLFSDISFPEMPRGLKSIVRNTHVGTAKRLSHSEDISLNVEEKNFFDESNPENVASVQETNILCSAMDIFVGISEIELIDFLNYIAKYPEFASDHVIGRRIHEIILSFQGSIGFDADCYYHARSLGKGICPYTEAQLAKAPNGITWHGRYNHIGESHYYFSDKVKGAIAEVKKHSPKGLRIQVAKVKPKQTIRMLDLSTVDRPSKFLEYCRFSPRNDDYSNVKREYLIPCFVASCCKKAGIEGIRYYGSKEYANYVAWSDHYFDCVGYEFIEPTDR